MGFIQDRTSGWFLSCDPNVCQWTVSSSQQFSKGPGNNSQFRFHVWELDGTDTGLCLVRAHCHEDHSLIRTGLCNDCGAVHWNFDPSNTYMFAEDNMKNCIQSNAALAHCKTYAPIRWPVAPAPKTCEPVVKNPKPVGQWIGTDFSSLSHWTKSITKGVTHVYSKGTMSTWGTSATNSLSLGFEFKGASIGKTISSTVSTSFSTSYSETLMMTETTSETWNLTAGQVWQWQFTFKDQCGTTHVLIDAVVQTNSYQQRPCCLPGYFKNPSDPTGECWAGEDGKIYTVCSNTQSNVSSTVLLI